jgi:transposase
MCQQIKTIAWINSLPLLAVGNFLSMPRLDIVTHNIAIERLEAGESQYTVAEQYNVHMSTISRIWKRYLQTGTSNRPRTGCPRITTAQQDRYIRIFHLRNRTLTATQTVSRIPDLPRISEKTVRNRLREVRLRARRPCFGLILGRQNRRARVGWCNTVWNWTLRN